LAAKGAAVAVLDARVDAARAVAQSITAAGGVAIGIGCDVRDESAVVSAIAESARALHGLDTLVCSAGITRPARTHQLSLTDWHAVLDVNLTGTFLAIREAIPHLIDAGASAVVTIGSVASIVAAGRTCAYDASKAGVLQLTRSIAVEYADDGLRANCLCPGAVATDLVANTRALLGPDNSDRTAGPSMTVKVPMGRVADPAEIAAVVAFLVSDDASFMTAAAVPVDGGYTAI
ncbi:MAG: short-chain dehydrogenase/reductase, partial [Blastococcus sp.]|nr:short-chain dehydrogenase/reductase [Blastococcus sp.]